MADTPLNVAETQIQAGASRVAGPLVIAAGTTRVTVTATLVSSDWLAAGAAATGTVTLEYQRSDNGGQSWTTFDTNTWPNNLHRRDGGLPGVRCGWGDGQVPMPGFSLQVVATPSIRMRLGLTGQVTTEP